jgi:hypothetical protein
LQMSHVRPDQSHLVSSEVACACSGASFSSHPGCPTPALT